MTLSEEKIMGAIQEKVGPTTVGLVWIITNNTMVLN
jgi:hypothetical protein